MPRLGSTRGVEGSGRESAECGLGVTALGLGVTSGVLGVEETKRWLVGSSFGVEGTRRGMSWRDGASDSSRETERGRGVGGALRGFSRAFKKARRFSSSVGEPFCWAGRRAVPARRIRSKSDVRWADTAVMLTKELPASSSRSREMKGGGRVGLIPGPRGVLDALHGA